MWLIIIYHICTISRSSWKVIIILSHDQRDQCTCDSTYKYLSSQLRGKWFLLLCFGILSLSHFSSCLVFSSLFWAASLISSEYFTFVLLAFAKSTANELTISRHQRWDGDTWPSPSVSLSFSSLCVFRSFNFEKSHLNNRLFTMCASRVCLTLTFLSLLLKCDWVLLCVSWSNQKTWQHSCPLPLLYGGKRKKERGETTYLTSH